eukprot:TRINITY_DN3685_c0_g2_i4.p1 TRINITY_DN3685_c0_g2~~TRINITY_DN3685_c0_g2_i4.p1  ORF type:complete len:468 (+),score=97.03 TRINITY_DN3685_c0_g2_i4:923-2326(+)
MVNMSKLGVSGIDSLSNLTLLKPTSAYSFYNELAFGKLGLSLQNLISVATEHVTMKDNSSLVGSISGLDAFADVLLQINTSPLLNLTLPDATQPAELLLALLAGLTREGLNGVGVTWSTLDFGLHNNTVPEVVLRPVPPLKPQPVPQGMLRWNDSKIIEKIAGLGDMSGIIDIVVDIVAPGGALALPLEMPVLNETVLGMELSVNISNISLSGLDKWNKISLLRPIGDNYSLASTIGLGALGVDVGLDVQVNTPKGKHNWQLVMHVNLTGLEAEVEAELALDIAKMASMQLCNLLEKPGSPKFTACWLEAFPIVQFTNLNVSYSMLELGIEGLPAVLEHSITNITDYLLGVFSPAVVHNLVAGAGRDGLNSAIISARQTHQGLCTVTDLGEPHYFNYEESLLVRGLNAVLGMVPPSYLDLGIDLLLPDPMGDWPQKGGAVAGPRRVRTFRCTTAAWVPSWSTCPSWE